MSIKKIHFNEQKPFDFQIKYVEIDRNSPENQNDTHIHKECEIYLNLSGDVSFEVENHIYPVSRGSIILTQPYEYHHCIYHSDKLHKHYWILFTANGNEHLFDAFYKRDLGNGNLIQLSPSQLDKIIQCFEQLGTEDSSDIKKRIAFYEIIDIISDSCNSDQTCESVQLSPDVKLALQYIDNNFSKELTVNDISAAVYVSVNTLERHFLKELNSTPIAFLRKKRLIHSAELLRSGKTVTEALEQSGFSDYSNFIQVFRKQFGITPFKYKKLFEDK